MNIVILHISVGKNYECECKKMDPGRTACKGDIEKIEIGGEKNEDQKDKEDCQRNL